MSYRTTESDNGTHSSYYNQSPAADNGSDCRSTWEGYVLKKGPWSSAEDAILIDYVKKYGEGNWNAVQKDTSLFRCGKSCRLRWVNHLRPNLKKGAFSLEEEQLIVELHAKMGNRWARMAAHLPGRTDNEIKNYWNTLIKRRRRAGLPLYPSETQVEVLEWSQEYTKSRVLEGYRSHQDFLQLGSCESNVFSDMVPSASYLTDMSAFKFLGNGASSHYENFMPPIMASPKRSRESESLYPCCSSTIKEELPLTEHFQTPTPQKNAKTYSFSVPCDVDPSYGNQHSSVMILDSHTLTDGIVPTSKPSFGVVKMELPSFQYSEATFDQWKKSSSSPNSDLTDSSDAYIQSPQSPMWKPESDCFSNYDTGLLDMLPLEAKIRKNSLYKSCATTSSADIAKVSVSQIKSEEFDNSFKSLVHSEISISTQHNEDGNPPRQGEKDLNPVLELTRPDVLLASSWLDHGLGIVKETGSLNDTLAVLRRDDIGNDYMHMSVSAGSCSWSNMPPVYQMTELP